jgi:hypothetical protein
MLYTELTVFILRIMTTFLPTPVNAMNTQKKVARVRQFVQVEFTNPNVCIQIRGDVFIGMLLPVHKKSIEQRCGAIWEQYGIQRTEVALREIDRINNNSRLLRGIRLGIEVGGG